MKTLNWISKTLGKRKWMIAFISILQGLLSIGGVLFAVCLRQVIDNAIEQKSGDFWKSIVVMGVVIFSQIALRWLERFVEDDTRAVIENRLRQRTFENILKTEYAKTKEYHTGELMTRITADASIVTDGAVSLIPSLSAMIVRILGVLFVMESIEPRIALFFLIGGCFIAVVSFIPRKWQKKAHKKVQEADGKSRSFLQESLESLLVIRAFGCEEKMVRSSEEKMDELRYVRRKRNHIMNFFGTGLRFCIQCGYLLGLIWCGYGLLQGQMSPGTLTALLQLIGQIQAPFVNAGSMFPKYTAMLASAERLMEFSSSHKAKSKKKNKATREEVYKELEAIDFREVTFSYEDDRTVLEEESFSVRKGEFVAIVGHSGIGKSTIMKLLLSVYEPNEGKIVLTLGDKELRLSELPRGMFSYVPQGNCLMSGSIWEIVGFAEMSEEIDCEKVKRACRIACAEEFIEELAEGYDTILGEHGHGLSEGQMQRLAVARAIYSECPILLLDEATSALDIDTEKRLITSLKKMTECTVFIVTHRQNVWELCDRVLEREE